MMQDYGLSGKSTVNMKVTSAPQGPNVKGTANLSNGAASLQGMKLANIASTVDFTMKDASGKLTADTLKHEYMNASKLDAKWNLTDVTDMAKLAGTASLRTGPGQFQNIQKLTSDSKIARTFFSPLTVLQKIGKASSGAIKLPSMDKMDFKDITGDYTFKAGVMTITNFLLNGPISNTMKGTVGLTGKQALNLSGQIKSEPGLIGGTVGEILKDDQGRASLDLTIGGTIDSPDPKVNYKNVQKKALDTIKEKYGADVQEKAKDILTGHFKH
jgi:hypothetical protein